MIDVDYKIIVAKNHKEVEENVKVLLQSNLGWKVGNFIFNSGFFIQVMVRQEPSLIILKDGND